MSSLLSPFIQARRALTAALRLSKKSVFSSSCEAAFIAPCLLRLGTHLTRYMHCWLCNTTFSIVAPRIDSGFDCSEIGCADRYPPHEGLSSQASPPLSALTSFWGFRSNWRPSASNLTSSPSTCSNTFSPSTFNTVLGAILLWFDTATSDKSESFCSRSLKTAFVTVSAASCWRGNNG